MAKRALLFSGLLALFAASYSAPVLAAADVVVMTDEAKVVNINGEPGTIVVGNPNIADVTVQGNQIFVHGRNFGSTNLIVLDHDGKQLAAFDITVMLGGPSNVSVFKAGSRFSYVCAPGCEGALQVGDKSDYFEAIGKQNGLKVDLATGASSKTSD